MIWAIVLLGGLDVAATAWGLHIGVIEEANPLLASMLGAMGGWAWFATFALSALAAVVLWCLRRRCRFVPPAMWLILTARVLAIGLHIRWIVVVFG
jgi:hypothetical protein